MVCTIFNFSKKSCVMVVWWSYTLQWRHNGRGSVSNHQPYDWLLNRWFRCRSKKTWKLRVTGLCVGNSPGTGEFPGQMASNAENVSIWWCHHGPSFARVNAPLTSWQLLQCNVVSHWLSTYTKYFLYMYFTLCYLYPICSVSTMQWVTTTIWLLLQPSN